MNLHRDDAEAEAVEQLAARAAANLLLARIAAVDAPEAAADAVSRADLWLYANRAPGAPHDFRVERAVRSDADMAQRYAKLMALKTRALSRMAAAAYEPGAAHRKLGPFSIDVMEEEGAPPTLLIERLEANHPAPTMIEAVAIEGVARVALPAEVEGQIVLDLPKDDPTRDFLRLLLANPHAAVYLI
ncbi:MAG: hypothetical protein ACRC7C_00525 [Beijerinckiaceae bacterium]